MATKAQVREAAKEVLSREDLKDACKEALKEWLDEQFERFGRFTFYGLLSAGLAAMIYFILVSQGWHR